MGGSNLIFLHQPHRHQFGARDRGQHRVLAAHGIRRIGDTVNLASRLETATKDLGVGILISEYTYNALRGTMRFRQMGTVTVKGRTEPVQTYTPEELAHPVAV
jgi:class 3 adenylate cyclase